MIVRNRDGLGHWHNSGCWSCVESLGPAFESSIQHMNQFAQNGVILLVHDAGRHVLTLPQYKNDIYMPTPGVSNPVENRSCPESAHCCARCVILYGYY